MSERLIRMTELTLRTGLSRSTIWRLERAGKFPRRRALVGGTVCWLESEVTEWMRSRPAMNADAPAAA